MLTIHYMDGYVLFAFLCFLFNLPLLWWFLSYFMNFGFFIIGLVLFLHMAHGVFHFFGISLEVPNLGGSGVAREQVRIDARRGARRHWDGSSTTPRGERGRRVHGDIRAGAGTGRERRRSRHRRVAPREEYS
ncbi:hypothetical protein ONS96_002762 [Cadophora gregata f. sp. sojae]|nr:hypothetical protein ONS96_002762 [Cadophora gregata f. sp. sojae]